jgi:Tol biopolymer transport system component
MMKSTYRVPIIIVGILLIGLFLFLVVLFPNDRFVPNPAFPELTGQYLGQQPPGPTPELFAPMIIDEEVHTAVVFSPDGNEMYWRLISEEVDEILFMKFVDGKWIHPQVVPFASRFFDSDNPCFSPHGDKLFFTSWRPQSWYQVFEHSEGIWYVEREEDSWSKPKSVGQAINSMNLHWQLSVSERGSLFFSSEGDIYQSRIHTNQYQAPIKLAEEINSPFKEGHPYIAPDESYLIFSSNRQVESMGDFDLYVSVQRDDGVWSQAINLGVGVNSDDQDLYPVVSPDQNFLFFISNRDGMYRVYWVDFGQIQGLIAELSQ